MYYCKDKRQKTKDKRQKTKDKRQKTKDKRQKTKDKRQKIMNKLKGIILLFLVSSLVLAQVGINVSTPQSTFDIRGTNHQGANTATDGILVPRVSSLGVNGTVNGQMLYLIADDATNGYSKGFHYWTGTEWSSLAPAKQQDWYKASTTNSATSINDSIYTNGFVGIGINVPNSKLDIRGTTDGENLFQVRGPGSTSDLIFTDMMASDYPTSLSVLSTKSDGMMIQTPVSSNLVFKFRNNDGSDGVHFLNAGGFHVLTLNAGQRVGIRKANPAYALDVDGDINASGSVRAGGVALTSDSRLKRNIEPLSSSIDQIMELNPVIYDKKSSISSNDYNTTEVGFVAQELQKIFPDLVEEDRSEDKVLSVQYIQLIPVLVKALQEQQKEIEELRAMIEE